MPEISRFLRIVIGMFYRDHVPPHFHAAYGEYEVTVDIETGVVHGRFPKRALRRCTGMAGPPQRGSGRELAKARRPLQRIEPLE